MAKCSYCSTTILFGAFRREDRTYCSDRCYQSERLLRLAEKVPADVVEKKVAQFHQRRCPRCGGPGPCDVYRTYKVWSLLFTTRWTNIPQVCCRSCGRKSQLEGVFVSLLLGWWGLPWGIIVTPLQVGRNLAGMFRRSRPGRPSAELEKLVRVGLAAQFKRDGTSSTKPAA